VFVCLDGSDTISNGSGDSLSEDTNRKGLYSATVTEALNGTFYCYVEDSAGTVIATGWVYLQDDTGSYTVSAERDLQLSDFVINDESTYYEPVYRSHDNTQAIYFEWTSSSASFTLQYSVNGAAFSASADTPSFVRSTGDSHVYSIPYNGSERPTYGVLEYKVSDGTTARVIPVFMTSAATQSSVDTVDSNVDAILIDTGTTLPATLTTIEGKVDTVDTVVDAVKVKTDQLTFTVANQVDSNALTGGGGDDAATIYSYFTSGTNEDAFKADVSSLATAANLATVDTVVDSIKAKTDLIPAGFGTEWANVYNVQVTGITTTVEAAAGKHSVAGTVMMSTNASLVGGVLTAKKPSDDTTFQTYTVTTSASADNITGVS
jgi:hypothetical protein